MNRPQAIKHATVAVIVLTQERPRKVLLLHHRKFDKWMPPGGHVESWENPMEAAIREAREETGLDIAPYLDPIQPIDHSSVLPRPSYMLESKIQAYGDEPEHYHTDICYVVHIPEQAVNHNVHESHDIRWFDHSQLVGLPLFDNVRHLINLEITK